MGEGSQVKGTEKRPAAVHRTSRPAAVAVVGFPRSTALRFGRRSDDYHGP